MIDSKQADIKLWLPDASADIVLMRNRVAEVVVFCLAISILLLGSPLGDSRFSVSGVPLAPAIFLSGLLIVTLIPAFRVHLEPTVVFLLPVALLGLSLFGSKLPEYGASKYFNLLAVCIVVIPLLYASLIRIGTVNFGRLFILVMLALLVVSIVYKARFGFFDRTVPFLMNGAIVFGRLMGLAAVLSLFVLKGPVRLLSFLVFGVSVVWTMSKGPLLALGAATLISVLWLIRGKDRIRLVVGAGFVFSLGSFLAWDFLTAINWGRLAVIGDLLGNLGDQSPIAFGSVGSRQAVFIGTVSLIEENPLGVGLGSWSLMVSESFGLQYPHNIVLELWSEAGIFVGTLALAPFLAFLLSGPPALRGAGLFLLFAQLVSGDLLDARYLLTIAALVALGLLHSRQSKSHHSLLMARQANRLENGVPASG
jgi:hypothetical protein